MGEKNNLSETYREKLRDRIIDTAFQLFVTNGIRAVRMNDIVDHLSISKRTLYEVFEDKEQLLLAVIEYQEDKRNKLMAEYVKDHDVLEIVIEMYRLQVQGSRRVNPQFYADLRRYPDLLEKIRKRHKKNGEKMISFFKRGAEEGLFRSDVDYVILVDLIGVQMEYIMNSKMQFKYEFSAIFKNVMLVNVRGLCTEKGFRLLEEYQKRI